MIARLNHRGSQADWKAGVTKVRLNLRQSLSPKIDVAAQGTHPSFWRLGGGRSRHAFRNFDYRRHSW
jgi:hypothetical protein